MTKKESSKKLGFTLLELLIVIAIIAILSVVVVLFINPTEMLKKGRDVQRISDLATLKTAINLYLQDSVTADLDGGANDFCGPTTGTPLVANSADIRVNVSGAGVSGNRGFATGYSATTSNAGTDNSWIPVPFQGVTSGAPVSNLPLDPTNSTTYYYRYGCWPNNTFEIDAKLESDAFTLIDNRESKDGGGNDVRYEVGTDLRIIP